MYLGTIGDHGSGVTAIAMGFQSYQIRINDQHSNPKTLNEWLKMHDGYLSDDTILWKVFEMHGEPVVVEYWEGFKDLQKINKLSCDF